MSWVLLDFKNSAACRAIERQSKWIFGAGRFPIRLNFKHEVMKLVNKKVKAEDTETVIHPEEEAPSKGAQVIDLTELPARSLQGGRASKPVAAKKTARRKPAKAAVSAKPRKAA